MNKERRALLLRSPRLRCGGSLKTVVTGWTGALLIAISLPAGAAANDVATPSSETPPPPTRDQCFAAHQSAQELKRRGSLIESREQLAICSSAGCPGAIISDCGQWIADLEQLTPSMVFQVSEDGHALSEFEVDVDGVPVLEVAKAFKADPGRHIVRAHIRDRTPQEQTLVLPEGQRLRMVSFDFRSKDAPSAPVPAIAFSATTPPVESARPIPVAVYPLLGAAAAGLASFGVFAYVGRSKQNDLERQCSPNCSDDDLAPMKRNYLIGDIFAGVGAAALVTAGVVYFTRPTHVTSAGQLSVRVGSASPRVVSSLAIAVSRSW